MQRNLKNGKTPNTNKGITLVALVITIIVLLILAGVAINMAINSDGLFGKANEATEKWNESIKKEETAISDLLTELDRVSPMAVEISTNIPEGWDKNKVQAVATAGSRKAPIPVGFTVSSIEGENTIGGGLVIYQGTDAVTGEANSTAHVTAMETRNQFVWIPVDDINQMVMCKSNSQGSVCNLKLVNGILQCTNSAHSTNATNLCGRTYSTDVNTTITPNTTSMNFSDRSQVWNETGEHEPNVVSGIDVDDSDTTTYMVTAGITSGKVNDFKSQLIKDFNAMATSVAKYGGFYISRYEIGQDGASKKNQKILTAGIASMWYGLYEVVHKEININDKNILQSHIIWGSQYDQVINFIGEQAQVGHSDRNLGGTSASNSGLNRLDLMNNIYDLEGNLYEWTAETVGTEGRAGRAETWSSNAGGSFLPAARSFNWLPSKKAYGFSTRSTLYL